MARVVYVGDAVTAAGYRLGGAETLVPPGQEAAAAILDAARSDIDLLLVSSSLRESLPEAELARLLLQERPLVRIVPDVFGAGRPPDLGREVRLALGIEA